MAEKTGIAWCDSTFNPWIGCTKVGPGCDHCYAADQDARKRWDGGKVHWGVGVPRYRTSAANWMEPLRWNKKAAASGQVHRVFCSSLADVFDNEVPEGWRQDLWDLIEKTPHLTWLLVTKRVGNVAGMVPRSWSFAGFPKHVRLLITVVNQDECERDVPKLLALPCFNGISYEPALGPVQWDTYLLSPMSLDGWIIVGGESGGKARPFDLGWAASTVSQCGEAGVKCFVKQMGSSPTYGCDPAFKFHDRAGADPAEWPADLRVQEFPQ